MEPTVIIIILVICCCCISSIGSIGGYYVYNDNSFIGTTLLPIFTTTTLSPNTTSLSTTIPPITIPPIITPNYFTNKTLSVQSGNCLDLNNTTLSLNTCNGNDSQKWSWNSGLKALTNKANGKCVDYTNNTINGNTCNNSVTQQWYYSPDTKLLQNISDPTKCIDNSVSQGIYMNACNITGVQYNVNL